MIIFYFVDLM